MATTEDNNSDWDESVKTVDSMVDDSAGQVVGGSELGVREISDAAQRASTDDHAGGNQQYAITEGYEGRDDSRTDVGNSAVELAMPSGEFDAVLSGAPRANNDPLDTNDIISPVVDNRVADQRLVSIAPAPMLRTCSEVPRQEHLPCGGLHHGTNTAAEERRKETAVVAVREQRSIRQDILDLTHEDGRETVSVLDKAHVAVDVKVREDGNYRGIVVDREGGGAEVYREFLTGEEKTYSQKKSAERQHKRGEGGRLSPEDSANNKDALQDTLPVVPSQTRGGPIFLQRTTNKSDAICRVKLADQAVTSLSLAEAVESTLSAASSLTSAHDEQHFPFWSLVIGGCQLPSLLPVAGLLHYLNGLCVLEIDGCLRIALTGFERVLEDAPCLHTLTLRRCGISQLPQLQSGSVEVLDISENRIKNTAGLETLFRLKRLNMAGNCVRTLMDLRPLVPLGAGSVRELNLAGNPVQEVPRCGITSWVYCGC